jgi:O-acetyl-ADP-ribose deacetylase (regulator of RNase III)
MSDELTPEQRSALAHWSAIGAPGSRPADGWVPSGLTSFSQPVSGEWPVEFDVEQTALLIRGHRAMEMEDKWHVVSLPTGDDQHASVVFLRSWTGNPVVRVDLRLTESGSVVEKATWEMDASRVTAPSEEFARSQFLSVFHEVLGSPRPPISRGGPQLVLHRGDITRVRVDAIVNAANSALLGGGGVDGAIHRAGGGSILAACRELRATTLPDGLPAGQAVATTAGDLPARWVIHTVGPVWSASEDRSETLASCYRESLRVADELGASAVAFPAISAGVYGWPVDDAARVAVSTVRSAQTSVRRVVFAVLGDAAATAFENAL